MKKIIQNIFKAFGYKLQKLNSKNKEFIKDTTFTMQGALNRCVSRGLNVNTVIDVGASNGSWSKTCLNIIPEANYLLIEAQDGHLDRLEALKAQKSNVDYVISAAGKEDGVIYFDNTGLFGGIASQTKLESNCIKVPMISLDNEINRKKLEPPFLLKLDTHGFEVPILEGAKEILRQSELVILETYNYQLTKDSLKYHEMCSYMEKLGFSSVEMVDFMLREFDESFWQMDTFFVPKKNKNFSYNFYK